MQKTLEALVARSKYGRIQRLLALALAVPAVLIGVEMAVLAQDRGYQPQDDGGYRPDNSGPRPISPPRDYDRRSNDGDPGYGQPYTPPSADVYRSANDPRDAGPPPDDRSYSSNEILDAGRHFFGDVSEGMARVVEYAFRRQGRPNGYILGEEAGGAVVAGLRYGEGVLHTKGFRTEKVYWQGPSVGYDFGANGSKTLTLVYNLRDPREIFDRYGGVEGSAYFVGGVGITFQRHDDVVLAPIRAGVGLRLGANVGYLKYTPSPTWNPF